MKMRRHDFALGLTTIAFMALFIGTFLFLYPALQGGGEAVTVHFDHEQGLAPLKEGSLVLLADSVEVGQVLSVSIDEIPASEVDQTAKHTVFVVQIEISSDVSLYGDCEISTNQPAVGGSGYVSILNVGTPGVALSQPIQGLPPQSLSAAISTLSRRLLAEGGFVDQLNRAVDPTAEDSIMHKVLASLDDLNAMTHELRAQMSPDDQVALLGKIHRVLDDFNATTGALRAELTPGNATALLGKIHGALDQLDTGLSEAAGMLKESRPVVRSTLASIDNAARRVDQELLAALQAELDPANTESMLGKLHAALDSVKGSLADLQTISTETERMVVLSRPALERMVNNFEAMSEQLRLASQEVLLNPSKLIWGPDRKREDQLVVFQAASNFAEAARQLDNAVGRLEGILSLGLPDSSTATADDEEIQAIRDAVRAAFERFGRAEEALWEQLQ